MIQRIVLIKLVDAWSNPEGRAAVAQRARDTLAPLPQVRQVTVGLPADEASVGSWDVSIDLRFASLADVEPYRVSPAHRAFVDGYLGQKVAVLKAWSFEIPG